MNTAARVITVSTMRRTVVILALVAASVAIAAPAGHAHFCANPVEMRVAKSGTVNIGIAAEAVVATGVDVTIPKGFVFERAVEYAPWTATRRGNVVEFRGGAINPFTCAYFSVVGTAPKKGAYPFHLATRNADGTVRRYTREVPFGEFAAQMVYAGVPIPDAGAEPSKGRGSGGLLVAFAGAVLAGGAVVGFLVYRDRRAG